MPRKSQIDAFGATALIGFSALLGFNQVAIKVANAGLQPVFAAGLRSLGGIVCLWLVFRIMGHAPRLNRAALVPGLISGCVFGAEFIFLYQALDFTSVSRTSVIFYSMPVWAALGAHVLLPDSRLTLTKSLGLSLAFAGVCIALLSREPGAASTLIGDVYALAAALCWASILLITRTTRLQSERPESQLFWQVTVSAPILLGASLIFGPLIRAPDWTTWASLAFQTVAVVTLGFALWFWLLSIYPPASVAAFSFLSPIFGVAFGWLLLNEALSPALIAALALVTLGLWLINKPAKSP